MKKILLFIIVALAFRPTALWSKSAGATAFDALNIGVGARPAGMGEAFTGLADDANALYWNPAGLGQLKRNEATFVHNNWAEEIKNDFAGYVHPTKNATLGVSFSRVTYGTIQGYDNGGAATGKLQPNDFGMTFSAAKMLDTRKNSDLYGGLSLKYMQENLVVEKAKAWAFDTGLLYKKPEQHLGFSVVLQNVGGGPKFVNTREPLPLNLKLGSAVKLFNERWILTSDFCLPTGYAPFVNVGTEFNIQEFVYLRAGWRSKSDLGNGLQYGLGLRNKNMSFDYALVPFGTLGATNRISLSLRFGKMYEDSLVESDIENNFKKAKANYYEGKLIDAYRRFESILAVAPRHKGALDYLARTQAKVEEGSIAKEIGSHFTTGEMYFKVGDYIKAKAEFNTVLSFDPGHPAAKEYLSQIEQRYKGVVDLILNQGLDYYKQSEYDKSLNEMEKVLTLDPENKTAQEYTQLIKEKQIKIEQISNRQLADSYFKQGVSYYKQGAWLKARTGFEKAVELKSENSELPGYVANTQEKIATSYYEEGMTYFGKNDLYSAINKFNEALKFVSNQPQVLARLNEATTKLKEMNSKSAEKYNNDALREYGAGNLKKAITNWQKALELEPGLTDVQNSLERARKELQ